MPARKKTPQDRSCILVMGMHRSGTSALTGVLGLLGAALPQTLMPKADDNPKGYFESYPIYHFNEKLLDAMGSRWDDWRRFEAARDFPGRAAFETRARALLEQEFGDASQFVFKDPRLCRMGEFWLPLLREQGCRIVALHMLRSPWEVVASLTQRGKMLPEKGLLLWLRHTLEAERLTRNQPRFHASYDLLMQDWRELAEKAAAALGLIWRRGPDETTAEIDDFLTDDLRHFFMPAPLDSLAWDWVRDTHDILRAWGLTGEVEADHARLDAIRGKFDAAEPVLVAILNAATARQNVLDGERRVRLEEEESHLRDVMALKVLHAQAQAAMESERKLHEQLSVRLSVVERDLQTVRAEARALRSSTSWRMTAPLRRVIQAVRRKKTSGYRV